MGWFNTGNKAKEKIKNEGERQEKAREEARKNRLYRFWLKGGTDALVTFIDNPVHPLGYEMPVTMMEHQLKINNDWRNWFTCLRDEDDPSIKCPLCEAGDTPSLVAVYTIIDHSEWTDKKNNLHKDEMKLFVCKAAVQKVLLKAEKKKDGLRGWQVEVTRSSGDALNTGDQFDFERRFTEEEFEKKYGMPLPEAPDYQKLFAPKSPEELQKVISGEVVADDEVVRF